MGILLEVIFTLKEVKENKGFCVLHVNIRSLLPKFDEVKLHLLDGSFEVLGFSESWLHHNIESKLVQVHGYNLIRLDRSRDLKKRGGGLCLYTKENLNVERLDKEVSNAHLELLSVKITRPNQKDLFVLSLYRPPTGSIDEFCNELKTIVQSLLPRKDLLVLGDFNINYENKVCASTKKLLKWEKDLLLTQLVKGNTRTDVSSTSCIDLIFSNVRDVKLSGKISLHLSDHVPIFLVMKKPRNVFHPVKLKTRGSRFDVDLLKVELNKVNWDFAWTESDPSVLWDKMFVCIMSVVNSLYPEREFTVKNDRPEYINDDIIRLGKERDSAFEKAIASKDDDDWKEAIKARRKANSGLRCSKYNYIKSNIENSSGDPKKFWMQVRVLIPVIN